MRIDFKKQEERIQGVASYPLVIRFLTLLQNHGFESACLGGYIRDQLASIRYSDIDIFVRLKEDGDEERVKELYREFCVRWGGRFQIITVYSQGSLEQFFRETVDYYCCLVWLTYDGVIHYGMGGEIKYDIEDRILRLTPASQTKPFTASNARHTIGLMYKGWIPCSLVLAKLLAFFLPLLKEKSGESTDLEFIEKTADLLLEGHRVKPGLEFISWTQYEQGGSERQEETERTPVPGSSLHRSTEDFANYFRPFTVTTQWRTTQAPSSR